MYIVQITEKKKQYLDLLLLADEQEEMIDRYLERGDMFVLQDEHKKAIAVAVVTVEGDNVVELKNLAVLKEEQGKGYGKRMIEYVCKFYSEKYRILFVGTGDVDVTVGFYKHCGFTYSHRVKNFFIENYDHPIYEDGVQLKDMVYLSRNI
ncbi:GNAT family N-acetyltransferase [Bacteroides caecicola]|uniref:GNAT family N-acetyltransferase n=1 Tax=Bacteroides caecicola TaxID=1462569 RepID=A0ABS2FAC3_9BACE|nr:GNAT family N-acetyltransferase [Bacteroides caecicola]MBM6807197.1 GNAT family N-acetyltransferase [Bacteroides caecicola]